MNNFERCISRQKSIDSIVKTLGNDDITEKNFLVKDKIMNPSHYVVMLGETSSGKSTLINGLFKDKILLESVKPTTGVVTEVVISDEDEEKLIAVNKDSSTQVIDKDIFDKLLVNYNKDLHKLKYVGKANNSKYNGMRIFDTPGYGSLVEYHEESLKSFIPQSDFIIYVVSYKVGIGDDDFQFLKYVGEIISEDVEVILAINMCPKDMSEDNKRILEIKKSVNKCIKKDAKTFFIESNKEKHPDTSMLWEYVYERVNDDDKKEELANSLKNYQDYILNECNIKINSKVANIESKKEGIEERLNILGEFLDKKHEILTTIDRGFTKIKVSSVKLIDKSAIDVKNKITEYVHDESKWTKKEETYTLMQNYYVPNLINEETETLMRDIESEIILLDKNIEDILKEAISKLEEKIKVSIPSYTEVMEGVLKQHIGDEIQQATGEMFRKATAKEDKDSISNPEDINLNKLGNIVDTKSYKHAHENLKHLLKAIKASSIKAITKYLTVFTESVFYLYDSLTWQKKINEISLKAIDNWAEDVEISIRRYLDSLRETNKEEIMSLFDALNEEFKEDEKKLEDISGEELIRLKKEIEFLLHRCLYISMNK
ncbi:MULTISPECIES: dynamin family protein [unclassified Clostridium]|uniref:dynamin family protein n=1 Tax=unclassified Clostridium TaxID=2614128 RepID=UPI0013F06D5A|nr:MULTISPECIES: dynamin family protein [unclassified Clostridium]NFG61494.1 GTP-binding protein [Clostridium botulinum]NFQ10476.1 GTP-binding protein [Clostridium botulinum]